jgi:quercetin dioxygenase-like cupin family protein
MLIRAGDAAVHTTPNATMAVLAAPAAGSAELAVWRVRMQPGQEGPVHRLDGEQVIVILDGAAEATVAGELLHVGPGDSLIIAAGQDRQIRAPTGLTAIVTTPAGVRVDADDRHRAPLPWAS